jgi:hypothetical protein
VSIIDWTEGKYPSCVSLQGFPVCRGTVLPSKFCELSRRCSLERAKRRQPKATGTTSSCGDRSPFSMSGIVSNSRFLLGYTSVPNQTLRQREIWLPSWFSFLRTSASPRKQITLKAALTGSAFHSASNRKRRASQRRSCPVLLHNKKHLLLRVHQFIINTAG